MLLKIIFWSSKAPQKVFKRYLLISARILILKGKLIYENDSQLLKLLDLKNRSFNHLFDVCRTFHLAEALDV